VLLIGRHQWRWRLTEEGRWSSCASSWVKAESASQQQRGGCCGALQATGAAADTIPVIADRAQAWGHCGLMCEVLQVKTQVSIAPCLPHPVAASLVIYLQDEDCETVATYRRP